MGLNEFNEQDNATHEKAFRKITEAMSKRNTFSARRGRLFPAFMTIAAVAVLGSVLWFSYPDEKEYREMNSVPLIRADAGPMKEVPNDPGGMEIPYRDSTVFDTLRQARADGGEGQVENLLSDSEEPISREQMFAGINPALEGAGVEGLESEDAVQTQDAEDENENIETVAAVKVDKGEMPVAAKTEDKTEIAAAISANKAVNAPFPAQKPEEQAQNWAKTEPAAGSAVVAATGTHLVQLASVRSRAAAQKAWASYQKQFPNELGALKLNIDVADLGTRGIYYRVQGGAVSEARARAICNAIDSKKAGGCFVVRN